MNTTSSKWTLVRIDGLLLHNVTQKHFVCTAFGWCSLQLFHIPNHVTNRIHIIRLINTIRFDAIRRNKDRRNSAATQRNSISLIGEFVDVVTPQFMFIQNSATFFPGMENPNLIRMEGLKNYVTTNYEMEKLFIAYFECAFYLNEYLQLCVEKFRSFRVTKYA